MRKQDIALFDAFVGMRRCFIVLFCSFAGMRRRFFALFYASAGVRMRLVVLFYSFACLRRCKMALCPVFACLRNGMRLSGPQHAAVCKIQPCIAAKSSAIPLLGFEDSSLSLSNLLPFSIVSFFVRKGQRIKTMHSLLKFRILRVNF